MSQSLKEISKTQVLMKHSKQSYMNKKTEFISRDLTNQKGEPKNFADKPISMPVKNDMVS
jgi:hypothetical protein